MRAFKYFIILALAVLSAILLTGFYIPVRLEVVISPEKLFQYEELNRDDLTVYLSPMFRRGKEVKDFSFRKETTDDYDDIVVQETIFFKQEHIRNLKLDSLDAVYTEKVHEGDEFDDSKIRATAHYKNGSEEPLAYEVIKPPLRLHFGDEIIIKTDMGSAKLSVPFIEAKELKATYEKAYEGDDFKKENVKVFLVYDDGEVPIEDFEVDGEDVIRGETHTVIYTKYGSTELKIDPVPVSYATSDVFAAGMTFNGLIRMVYEDGTEATLKMEDVEIEPTVLEEGVNHIPFTWKGTDYTLFVPATESTSISEARNLTDEINGSIYNYISSDLFVTIRRDGPEDRPFFLTHVVLGNPSQLAVETAKGAYGSKETPYEAAKRVGWIVGINGSFDTLAGCLIRNGQMLIPGVTNGYEICITNSGAMFSPPAGVPCEDLAANGVRDILITTDPLLMQDGEIYSEGDTTISGEAARTAVGMVRPGEYYFLTATALTYSEMQSVFAEFGCTFARSLDGGSSSALYFGEQAVNNATGKAVSDFLCVKGAP